MKVTAIGVLRHIFHGTDEAARIVLDCDTPERARNAAAALGPAWEQSTRAPHFVVGSLTRDELEAFKALRPVVEPCTRRECCKPTSRKKGAPPRVTRHEIDSVAHSIDVGPAFTVTIDCPAYVADEQIPLFGT